MRSETIIVKFVSDYVYADTRKSETKYLVQFAGFSDKGSKLMRLQVWDMPFNTREEANSTLNEYKIRQGKGESKDFVIVLMK